MNVGRLALIGAAAVAAVYLWKAQSTAAESIVARFKTKDTEQIAIGLVFLVGLGLVITVLSQAFRRS